MIYAWPAISLIYAWNIPVIDMIDTTGKPDIPKVYQGYIRDIPEICMGYTGYIHNIFLTYA